MYCLIIKEHWVMYNIALSHMIINNKCAVSDFVLLSISVIVDESVGDEEETG